MLKFKSRKDPWKIEKTLLIWKDYRIPEHNYEDDEHQSVAPKRRETSKIKKASNSSKTPNLGESDGDRNLSVCFSEEGLREMGEDLYPRERVINIIIKYRGGASL